MAVTNLDELDVGVLKVAGTQVGAGDLPVTGDLTVSGTLGVTGAATLSSTLGVTGAATLSGTLGVTGATTLTGAVDAKATATLEGPVICKPAAVAVLAVAVAGPAVQTKTIAADSTFTCDGAGVAGQLLTLIITASAAQRVATFGSNLNASGTLTIPSGKIGVISFVSDGTSFRESGRSINV